MARFCASNHGAMVLLLSAVGIVCCSAGIVGIWMFHQTESRSEDYHRPIDDGLQSACRSLARNASAALDKPARVWTTWKKAVPPLGVAARQRTVSQPALSGSWSSSRSDAISTTSVCGWPRCRRWPRRVSSSLQSFQESPPGQTGHIHRYKLEGRDGPGGDSPLPFRPLEVVAGDGNKESSEREVAAASSAVSLALQKCQAKVDDWQSQLETARQELQHARTEILRWFTPAMIAVAFACAWVAVGQVCLFGHALHWLRGT